MWQIFYLFNEKKYLNTSYGSQINALFRK